MYLVDTSVWIDHFRNDNSILKKILESEQVFLHPMIIGELSLGNLKNRQATLSLLACLPLCVRALDNEVLSLIESHKLFGKGIGWVDAHILTSTLISKLQLFTLDNKLNKVFNSL